MTAAECHQVALTLARDARIARDQGDTARQARLDGLAWHYLEQAQDLLMAAAQRAVDLAA